MRAVRRLFLLAFFVAAVTLGAGVWWLNQPVGARDAPALESGRAVLDLSIEPGTTARGVAQAVADAGFRVNPGLLYTWFRVSGQSRQR